MNCFDTFDPRVLLGDRLGLTLYRMFVEACLKGDCRAESKMYSRFIGHFPGEVREHTPANFESLINKVRKEGFDPRRAIYANPAEYSLVGGSHRCAIAMALRMTDVPYSLRFDDTRVDDTVFREIFSKEECDILEQKREEYISLLDPATAFRCRLRVQMRANPVSFQAPFSSKTKVPTLRPYQGLEDLEVKGKRPSRRRVDIYELGRWLDGSMRGLEIGCNVGFFTLVVSEAVASMDAFDIDPNYIKVARFTQDFLGNRNCNFSVRSVKDFRPERAYDFVISAAVHGWSGLGFAEYGERLIRCIRPGGLMLFESHELDAEHDWPEKKRALLEKFTVLGEGVIDDVDKGMYASEMREFLVLKDKR